nr:MAG TPA: hypothetical protein [Caudoviricetes sp.]
MRDTFRQVFPNVQVQPFRRKYRRISLKRA